MNPKLFAAKILGLLVATAFVAGCGTSTNPTSDYNLPQGVPVTENPNHKVEPLATQSVLPGDAFRVEIPSNMKFVEGQTKSYTIKIVSMLKGLTFSLQASGLPQGVSLTQVSAKEYTLAGTVPVGASSGLTQGESVSITLSALASGDKTSLAKFNTLLHSWTPSVTVFPTDKAPIVESQKMGLSVNEGDSLPIEIIVTDLGSHGSSVPEIQAPFQDEMQNGEVTFVPALGAVKMSRTPVAIGGGKYKFTGVLDTKRLNLPAGKKNITARFVINIKSPSGLISADEIVDVKVVRSAPAPAAVAQPVPAPAAAPATGVAQVAAPAQISASVKSELDGTATDGSAPGEQTPPIPPPAASVQSVTKTPAATASKTAAKKTPEKKATAKKKTATKTAAKKSTTQKTQEAK